MRKLISLIGFIILLFGMWGWSNCITFGFILNLGLSFFTMVAGAIILILGIVLHPKEIKEPFKDIAEKFENMNKPIIIASVFIFFSSMWLLSYGFSGLIYSNVADTFALIPYNNTVNKTINDTIFITQIHHLSNTMMILSYFEIIAGVLYVGAGINALKRKNFAFIVSSMVFGGFISILFAYFFKWTYEGLNRSKMIGISIASSILFHYLLYLLIPFILSIAALLILIWQYKEFKT